MNVLRPIGKALAAALALFLLVGLALPRGWRVERSVLVAAPPEHLAPLVLDLRRWRDWSPWTRALDAQVRHTTWGPAVGVGAGWSWLDPATGRGTVTITAADPGRGVSIDRTIEAEQVTAHAELTLTPEGRGTRVRWVDQGELPLLGGYFRGRVEARVARHLERGLVRLQALAEAR
jgi:hypothetical protein